MNDPPTAQPARELAVQAQLLRDQGRWSEALNADFAAAQADPDNPGILHNLAVLLTKFGRLEEGEAVARRALALAPDAPILANTLAHNLLAQGRLTEAWPLHAARAQLPELNNGFPRNFPFPHWQGEVLSRKHIAIFPEQGFGDQIQLARFLPQMIARAGQVTLLTRPPLVALFERNFPGLHVVPAEGNTEFPDPDYWATMYDLPAMLRVGLDDVPAAPYLTAPAAAPAAADGFRVGLRETGNPDHIDDRFRSLPDAMAQYLRQALPGTIVDLDPARSGARDFEETAAIIASLDLVVSVDTAVAHLAGALGKPCLLLVSGFSPDWRWMFDRDDSPWYPRHRLYRSETDGNWEPAVTRLIADVRAIAAGGSGPTLP
ncbi:glycosyltransferase family 9 protein [Sphingomonas crusticola]|uniref:glycosyltransferase family 9 protein n=1 Tax=Sphingomonas crusticola TaxID=1697973 RepID=UPI000E28960A|nr:tetratricopeptide repeat-containing glycosyltransferase family protein [Sphingomonas crusticola]